MIVAIEGQDGIGKTSAIKRINENIHLYNYGMKFPVYSYPSNTFITDGDYVKNTSSLAIEVFFNSKSFIERIDALKRFDLMHTIDKYLNTDNITKMQETGDIYLFDRYCLSQSVYSKSCAEILLEDYDDLYSGSGYSTARGLIKDLWYDVGNTIYLLPKITLTIVFVADSDTIKERQNTRTNDIMDMQSRLQDKVNNTYLNKMFTEEYANSEHVVTINTTGMDVSTMARTIQDTISRYIK